MNLAVKCGPLIKLSKRTKIQQKNKQTNKQNKTKIGYTITKWRPKNQYPSRDIKFSTKNGKTNFPKEFFHEIWLIIEDCKYNYTAEIKFEKKLFGCAFLGKQILNNALRMLIYANQQNLRMVDANFFFCHQKKLKVKLDKVREGLRPITLREN